MSELDGSSQLTILNLTGCRIMHPIGRTSRRLFIMNACAVAAAGCAGPPVRSGPSLRRGDQTPVPARPITPEELEELRAQIIEAHNEIREEAKLKKLTVNSKLIAAAQAHAEDMAGRRKMTHTGGDGSSPSERVKARGYRYFRTGENVAAGHFAVNKLMKGWMDSPAHKRNILGGFSDIGVGCAVDEDGKRYWCVTFGLPSSR